MMVFCLKLGERTYLANYWKFNNSVLEIRDFQEQLEKLIHLALVGLLSGIVSGITVKYCQKLTLDKAKTEKFKEDRLYQEKDPLEIQLTRRDLERKACERYQGFIVIYRLNRVSNESEIRRKFT